MIDGAKLRRGRIVGYSLPESGNLMTGPGVHRHVPLRASADLERPGLGALLQAALEAQRERVAQTKQKR